MPCDRRWSDRDHLRPNSSHGKEMGTLVGGRRHTATDTTSEKAGLGLRRSHYVWMRCGFDRQDPA